MNILISSPQQGKKLEAGRLQSITLRTFTSPKYLQANEIEVPIKEVRMWVFDDGQVKSLSKEEIFELKLDGYLVDKGLSPEESVNYKSAWDITL